MGTSVGRNELAVEAAGRQIPPVIDRTTESLSEQTTTIVLRL
jgi:hypothetical protein